MEKSVIGSFHGTEYQITVSTSPEELTLTLVSTDSSTKWQKSFTKAEIENLT